jgi:Transposase IS200 like
MEVSIVKGVVSVDHVHILVSCPPGVAPAELMKGVKGRSSRLLMEEFGSLRKLAARHVLAHWSSILPHKGVMPLAQTSASGFRLQACEEESMTIRLVRTMVAVLVLCGVAAVGFEMVSFKAALPSDGTVGARRSHRRE